MTKHPEAPRARPLSALGYPLPAGRLTLFRRLFALKIGLMDLLFALSGPPLPELVLALLAPAAALLAARERSARGGLLALAALRLGSLLFTLPYTINHTLLELVLLLGLALSHRAADDPAAEGEAQAAMGWAQVLFLSVWFYAGLQKAVHGYYWSGEFFGLEAFADDRGLSLGLSGAVQGMMLVGCQLFGGALPHASPAALTDPVSLPLAPWMAPFLIGLSRMIIAIELVVPLLFLWPRARKPATVALALAQVGIGLSSMELDFAFDNFLFLILLWPGVAARRPGAPGPAARFRAVSAALLLCWPLLHMALALKLGFSSWRFFGWGMYATPSLPRPPDVYLELEGGAITPLPVPLDDPGVIAAGRRLHSFERASAAGDYAAAVNAATGQPEHTALLLVTLRPRLDLAQGQLYSQGEVWRSRGEGADDYGSIDTRQSEYKPYLERLARGP